MAFPLQEALLAAPAYADPPASELPTSHNRKLKHRLPRLLSESGLCWQAGELSGFLLPSPFRSPYGTGRHHRCPGPTQRPGWGWTGLRSSSQGRVGRHQMTPRFSPLQNFQLCGEQHRRGWGGASLLLVPAALGPDHGRGGDGGAGGRREAAVRGPAPPRRA